MSVGPFSSIGELGKALRSREVSSVELTTLFLKPNAFPG
jgi:hypothetical protein